MKRFFVFAAALLIAGCATVPKCGPSSGTAEVTEAERVVQTQLDAYNAGDIDAFAATYADEVKLYDHPDKLRSEGIEALRKNYGERFATTPALHATITSRMVQGEYVIDHEHVTGLPEGREIRAVAIYHVREGRIQAVWFVR